MTAERHMADKPNPTSPLYPNHPSPTPTQPSPGTPTPTPTPSPNPSTEQ